ncbi:hypothetical protein ANPL_02615 [Anaplasma platys]|uniref:Uncharacterized protein n=1 Tax=Anaplasma platys TaxID=949 RepID=A0A858PYE1_9RICK|nr:hypothetical protein [Anaplasma platys]QJC27582.1 hypothetical protein ANPL_02615 [Anaplasma platys]
MSRARCFLIFFLLLCGIVGGGVFLCRIVIKDVTLGLLESLKGNGVFPDGMSVGYENISFGLSLSSEALEDAVSEAQQAFPSINVLLDGFFVSEKDNGMKLKAEAIKVSYGIAGRRMSVSLPRGFVDIENVSASFGEGYGDLRCSVDPVLVVEWRDNLFLSAIKKLLYKKGDKGAENQVVSFSYVDADGISCKDLNTGKDVSVYNDALFKFGVLDDVEVRADAEVNAKDRPDGKLSLKLSDVVVRFFKNERLSDVSITSAELRGDDFLLTLNGGTALSEKCGPSPLGVCEFELTLGFEGYDNFWKFFEEILQKRQVLDEDSGSFIMHRSMFQGIKQVIRDVSVKGDGDKLVLDLRKTRDGNVMLGSITLAEFFRSVEDVVSKSENAKELLEGSANDVLSDLDKSLSSDVLSGTDSSVVPEDFEAPVKEQND